MGKLKNALTRMFKPTFTSWDEYQARVEYTNMFNWQQSCRKRNLRGGN